MKSCPTCHANYPTNYAVCPQDGTGLVEGGAWVDNTVIRGKYRILNKVGQGGMGAVYKALHLAFDEVRALKVISQELVRDDLFVKRFKHEAVITRKLQHPNAVRVDDIDEAEDGRPFIVMEFIEGVSLKKLIQDAGPLPVLRVCSIIKQASSALEAAHQLGMVHRDIKPENIVLVSTGEGEQAKVLDFGIAKVKEARLGEGAGLTLTGTGVVIGTPQYMSPEQAMGKRGDELDGRSDIYSLGIVMYQMLTGELPFKADTTMEMLLAHMQKPPLPIRTSHPELQIPDAMVNLVMKCLEKKPELRPAGAQTLIEEIEKVEQRFGPVPASALRETIKLAPGAIKTRAGATGSARVPARPAGEFTAAPAPTPAPAPRAVSSPQPSSRWGLWAAIGIFIVGLASGGWFLGHRPTTEPARIEPVNPPPNSAEKQSKATDETPEKIQRPSSSHPTQVQSTQSHGPALSASENREKIAENIKVGDFYFKRGEYDGAIQEYQKGLHVDPSNAVLKNKIEQVRKAKAAEERVLQ